MRRFIAWQVALECGLGGWGLLPIALGDEPEPTLTEIVVTGSRIPVSENAVATTPLRVLTSQEILLGGYTDAVDLIDSLPQTSIDSGIDFGNHSNPASNVGGIATADLRGLGPQRTLVLVNGRRLGIGDPNTGNPAPAADLDQIPIAMIDRVEIITGGASSTYGSDAVAGVINFILKQRVDGIQIDAGYGLAQHNQHDGYLEDLQRSAGISPPTGSIVDGYARDLSILAGTPVEGGAGSVSAYFTYHRQDPIKGSARDFSNCQAVSINALTGVPTDPGFKCLGSPDSNKFVIDGGGGPAFSVDGGATHAAAGLAQCMRTGVTAAEYGDGYGPAVGGTSMILQCLESGCGQVIGGNPRLEPEIAYTWSVGATLTPRVLSDLIASIDYYRIRVDREIATIPGNITLQRCLESNDPFSCGQVARAADGSLTGNSVVGGGYVRQNDVNTGTALVSGIEVQGSIRWPLARGLGSIIASLSGNWLQHDSITAYAGAPSYDCAGLFGNTCSSGSVNPTWRHSLRLEWQTRWDLTLSAQWRFIGRTGFDNNSPQELLQYQEEGFYDPVVTHIPSYSYLDLSGIWTMLRKLQLRAGINNVLDKDPPFIPAADISGSAGWINSYPTYDLVGREIFLALHATL